MNFCIHVSSYDQNCHDTPLKMISEEDVVQNKIFW